MRKAYSPPYIAVLIALALAACPQTAAPPRPVEPPPKPMTAAQLDASLAFLNAQIGSPAMVVAVVRGDQVTVRGFGQMGPGDARVPDGATLVRLESVSKLLTSQVMVTLADQGKLATTDPLQRFAPADCTVPRGEMDNAITLRSLATHTSGLPRIAPIDDQTVPADRATAARWAWLRRQRDLKPPGQTALYSNVAYDLLADALAVADKQPYPMALKQWVTAPLAMNDTTPSPSAQQCGRMMASAPDRPPKPCVDNAATAGSGGVYSTAHDMALWMKAQLAGADPVIRTAQTILYRHDARAGVVGLDHAGPAAGVGLGWIELAATAEHPRLLEKTGGGDGFLSYIVLIPEQRIGVFVGIDKLRLGPSHPLTGGVNALAGALAVGIRPAVR
jgi:D-alanyl-D-alanine-carboxypeptidase/D-alanyl-D-alanine-endopeptidase